jgi:hypothetical protein
LPGANVKSGDVRFTEMVFPQQHPDEHKKETAEELDTME